MHIFLKYFLFILLVLLDQKIFAQNLSPHLQHEVDSMKRELKIVKEDSIKVRLLFNLGEKTPIINIGYWDSLVDFAHTKKLIVFEIRSLAKIGGFYQRKGMDLKAVDSYNKSILTAESSAIKLEVLSPLYGLSTYYSLHSDSRIALELCFKGLKIAEGLQNKLWVSKFNFRLGEIFFSIGNFGDAIRCHLNCVNTYTELKQIDNVCWSILALGADYCALNNTKMTIFYYMKSLDYINLTSSEGLKLDIWISAAAAYEMRQKHDSAIYYCNKAVEISKISGNKFGLASAMTTLADIYLKKGDLKMAKVIAEEALILTNSIRFTAQIPSLTLILKEIYIKLKDYKKALNAFEISVKTKDSIADEKTRKHVLEKEFNYNMQKKESENKLLAQQNQIQHLQLSQNKYFLFGLGGIAILILIIAYLILRQNKLRNEHQKMFMEQKLISSQMNPHFVFNSLNAIQHLIMNKENEKAEYYLSKFSKLIRELLESNTKESLSVREEVGILTGYLEMEARRFSKSFHYSIQVDERINQEITNIPHMMIQPFVENAIWHGLLPKSGARNLNILYEYDTDKTIRCIVEDNGVGREVAMKKENTFKKKSLALSFVKQRLDLMQETLKVNCYVKIIDKKNELGESLGTKVIIVLPLIN
jgi:tetratricopeptide (TPR) repeat protein